MIRITPSVLYFTPENWDKKQKVTVTGISDGVSNTNPRKTKITHTVRGADYSSGLSASSLVMDVFVVDGSGKILTLSSPKNILASNDDSYTLKGTCAGSADVKVSLSSSSLVLLPHK